MAEAWVPSAHVFYDFDFVLLRRVTDGCLQAAVKDHIFVRQQDVITDNFNFQFPSRVLAPVRVTLTCALLGGDTLLSGWAILWAVANVLKRTANTVSAAQTDIARTFWTRTTVVIPKLAIILCSKTFTAFARSVEVQKRPTEAYAFSAAIYRTVANVLAFAALSVTAVRTQVGTVAWLAKPLFVWSIARHLD